MTGLYRVPFTKLVSDEQPIRRGDTQDVEDDDMLPDLYKRLAGIHYRRAFDICSYTVFTQGGLHSLGQALCSQAFRTVITTACVVDAWS